MARYRQNILHWGNKYDGPNTYKDSRQGGATDAYWDEDELVDYPSPAKKKRSKKAPKVSGCAGNDGNAHVYVWTGDDGSDAFSNIDGLFYKHYGWCKTEVNLCIGCGKKKGYRYSERYEKVKARKWAKIYGTGENQPRGKPVPWRGRIFGYKPHYNSWRWEMLDPGYREKYDKLTDRMAYRPYAPYYYNT